MPLVTLYTKPGCHLCEVVEQAIHRVRARRSFELALTDITADAATFDQYKHSIPVVLINGVEVARYRMSDQELSAALDRAAGSSGS